MPQIPFNALATLTTKSGSYSIHRLNALEEEGLTHLNRLPFCMRILLESALRQINGYSITETDVLSIAQWCPKAKAQAYIPFHPARVVMEDLTGISALVDLAAMRSAINRAGGDPMRIAPRVPVDLVISHSVQVDFFASKEALRRNAEVEFQRNRERFSFLRWAQETFNQVRVVPPNTGILHQINLEFLSQVVLRKETSRGFEAFLDTLVGTNPHTTMINALGIVGWGVGGVEAEAAILGQPISIPTPQVIGVRLIGKLPKGLTATDLALRITQILYQYGVEGKFVEFIGPGLAKLSPPARATIANMAPEYGAILGYFPIDDETLRYLRLTGRGEDLLDLVERYCKEQSLFRSEGMSEPDYSDVLEFDLNTVESSIAGPKQPQSRISLRSSKEAFRNDLTALKQEGGFELDVPAIGRTSTITIRGNKVEMVHGAVVIAAITSCMNTSDPSLMVAAGLLAKKAVEKGLLVKPYVKTSLAPGSRVVTEYLREAGLLDSLAELGFHIVGYGCTTCIGNSGTLPSEVIKAINQSDLIVAAVLSGNRNYEGWINSHVRANYLASPPLVVAYALAGTMDIDIQHEPLGYDRRGKPVYLNEIWPTPEEIQTIIERSLSPEMFRHHYRDVFGGNETWNAIPVSSSSLYSWDPKSTYIQEPPLFLEMPLDPDPLQEIHQARALLLLGDSINIDHISPFGTIAINSPAGSYLLEHGVQPRDFNSYGSRWGNDRIMTRGAFSNSRIKNLLLSRFEAGMTLHLPEGEKMPIYDAAMKYKAEEVPLLILASSKYGCGCGRDWAAKGTYLLGVRAIIAESFGSFHRSDLIRMGILPVEYLPGENMSKIGLTGHERFRISNINLDLCPQAWVTIHAEKQDGSMIEFKGRARIDTPLEIEYYRHGGVLQMIFRQIY